MAARRVQLRELRSDRFLREIHHLLWCEPSLADTTVDAGWNCRDHAWVTALLARSLGHDAVLVHGEAHFIMGPSGRAEGVSCFQRPHSWLAIEGVGAIDLSTKSSFQVDTDRIRVPISCIFADEWLPRDRGRTYFFADATAYARAVDGLPRRRNHVAAVYLNHEAEELHGGLLTRAAGWIGSPLTQRLDDVYGNPSDLYAALLLHLHGFLAAGASSLAGLPFEEAWGRLAKTRSGAIERACLLTGLTVASGTGVPTAIAAR